MRQVSDIIVARKFLMKSKNAHDRNIPFSMTFKRFKQVYNTKHCQYTGVELCHDQGDNLLTVDRIDNTKGYTDDNVVACSKLFNQLKSDLTPEEIKMMYSLLKRKKVL